jgi:hypothetical protein
LRLLAKRSPHSLHGANLTVEAFSFMDEHDLLKPCATPGKHPSAPSWGAWHSRPDLCFSIQATPGPPIPAELPRAATLRTGLPISSPSGSSAYGGKGSRAYVALALADRAVAHGVSFGMGGGNEGEVHGIFLSFRIHRFRRMIDFSLQAFGRRVLREAASPGHFCPSKISHKQSEQSEDMRQRGQVTIHKLLCFR